MTLYTLCCSALKNKKILLFLTLLFSLGSTVHAQYYYNSEYNSFVGGVVAGANFTQVDGDSYAGYHKTGLNVGGIAYIPFGDQLNLPIEGTLALSVEVLYTQKGSNGLDAMPAYNMLNQNIRLDYAEVPVQLNFYRGSRKSIFGMGLAIGYLAFSEELIDRGGGQQLKNALPFNKFDFSYVLTANLHLGKGFFLSPRFQYSILSIRDNNGMFGGRNQQFNNVVSLRLMYLVKRRGE